MKVTSFYAVISGVSVLCHVVRKTDGAVCALYAIRDDEAKFANPAYGPAFKDARRVAAFLTRLLQDGMPWGALTSCRRSPGNVAAMIDAAAGRLEELQEAA